MAILFGKNIPFLKSLRAADSFVKDVDGTVQIWAANRDWFLEEWGRDTFISLPGILLVTKRFGEAKR
jgi:glycogen debranching enzyme